MQKIINLIKQKVPLSHKAIKNIITLLDDGATIAFIARYRKDLTSNATDEMLLKFQEVYEYSLKLIKRSEEILELLKEKKALTPKLEELIENAQKLTTLEDIYEPFKGVKSSRANDAIKNGLEPLANVMALMKLSKEDLHVKAKGYLNANVKSVEDALKGAMDIVALNYSQDIKTKESLRNNLEHHGILVTKKSKTFDENGIYKDLGEISQKAKFLKSHRVLAILRAQNEKQISIKIEVDEDYIIDGIKKYKIPNYANSSKEYVLKAYIDGLKRLLLPSLKRELLANLKQRASDEAIVLFGKNLQELLITPPLVNQVILGVDPGFKTGCKLAVIDENGTYLDSNVIYLLNDKQVANSSKVVLQLIKKYNISAIAIGNGTASKESATFISELIASNALHVKYAVVSEIGASIYSASKIAQEEYGFLDVTIRGAISIAQRLRDPMAALVKIDPKSLGVGQYQHDVNQSDLSKKLNDVTFSLVNKVGVDLNSASYKLLSFVSGISERSAKNIIAYKDEIKSFKSKKELLHVKGIGAKAYEQSVGFLRIKDGKSFLDNSAIHPENYDVALHVQKNYKLDEIDNETIEQLAKKFSCGVESLKDVIIELKKPGYDIREELEQVSFCEDIKDIDELHVGDSVNGVVRNITDFGAFIDIGLKNDGLLHISEYSHKRISHLMDVLHVNQNIKNIKIIKIDLEKGRVSLSLKD